jgi:hypothetical protein
VPDPLNLPEGFQEGRDYSVFQSSQDVLLNPFFDNIKGIAIVPNDALQRHYGVIAHNYPRGDFKERDWAHIYLPGCGTNDSGDPDDSNNCNTNGVVTTYGPFKDEFTKISSLTIFNVPQKGGSVSDIKICREDQCKKQKVEENGSEAWKDAAITYNPATEFDDISGVYGSMTSYSAGTGIVYGKNLKDVKWDTGNPITIRKNSTNDEGSVNIADGISSIEINEGGGYLALLYNKLSLDPKKINEDTEFTGAVVISATIDSLQDKLADGRVGTIIIINTNPGENY